MSWYYDYYLAEKNPETGLYEPLGPFDKDGKWLCAVSRSRSFASDMHERFDALHEEQCDENLLHHLRTSWGGDIDWHYVTIAPLSELPKGDILKRVYVRVSDIEHIEHDGYFDYWPDEISVDEYVARKQAQLEFNCEPLKDCEGNELTPIWEYTYYPYISTEGEEYEAYLIRIAAGLFDTWGRDIYVILQQG